MTTNIKIFEFNFGGRTEGLVMNCGHKNDDRTIYIANNPRHWRKVEKHGWELPMASLISHETLHLVLTEVDGDKTSVALDTIFGDGHDYKNEYHGLCKLNYYFYHKWNKVRK